jgi:hypothetical protein
MKNTVYNVSGPLPGVTVPNSNEMPTVNDLVKMMLQATDSYANKGGSLQGMRGVIYAARSISYVSATGNRHGKQI